MLIIPQLTIHRGFATASDALHRVVAQEAEYLAATFTCCAEHELWLVDPVNLYAWRLALPTIGRAAIRLCYAIAAPIRAQSERAALSLMMYTLGNQYEANPVR